MGEVADETSRHSILEGRIQRRAIDQLLQLVSCRDGWPDILSIHQTLQEGQQIQQLPVLVIIVPALYGDAVRQLVPKRLGQQQCAISSRRADSQPH